MECIVELENGVWLAPWEGDPARTIQIENAKIFKNSTHAKKAINKVLEYSKFSHPVIVPYPVPFS